MPHEAFPMISAIARYALLAAVTAAYGAAHIDRSDPAADGLMTGRMSTRDHDAVCGGVLKNKYGGRITLNETRPCVSAPFLSLHI